MKKYLIALILLISASALSWATDHQNDELDRIEIDASFNGSDLFLSDTLYVVEVDVPFRFIEEFQVGEIIPAIVCRKIEPRSNSPNYYRPPLLFKHENTCIRIRDQEDINRNLS